MNKITVVAALLLLAASGAWAQDFQVGSRSKGMGGSYTSFDEDPVSIWMNPAGIAGAPSRLGVDYQTFTQYELEDSGTSIGTEGKPQFGLIDPPIVPSFLGFTTPIARNDTMSYEFGIAYIRPFQNRLTYLNNTVRIQTEQQFSRFRMAFAAERTFSEEGWFHSLAGGVGLDLAYTQYTESDDAGALDRKDNETGFGGGLGLLLGLYTNRQDFSIDIGVAYQSAVHFNFKIDPEFFPVWQWPTMISTGFCVKLLDKMDLRITGDVQLIFWDAATRNDTTGADESFENSINASFGVEYYIRVTEIVAVLPRVGFRLYDAPWSDPDLLPAIGENVLSIDTRKGRFGIGTFGGTLQWVNEGKVRAFDVGIEVGGDTPNFSFGYRHDF